jgi:hypothetical protein
MDRKGWLLTEEDSTEPRVRSIWKAGAKLAIVPGAPVQDEVWQFLKTDGRLVFTAGRIVVYRLN